MYECIIEKQDLTTKKLNECGFNSQDLTILIKNGTLERIKEGYYSFKSVDDLFYYGKKLIYMKEHDKATACFERCSELDPNHLGVCFQLFLRCIQNRNYEKAFEYFDHIFNTDNKYYFIDYNFYLYLLSMITELPDKYKQYAKFLKFIDIRVYFNDVRYNNINIQNNIRTLSLNQKFGLALKQLNELIKQNGKLSVQDIVIKTLLSQAIEEQYRIKKLIIKLINEKKYEEIIKYLETLQQQRNLTIADEHVFMLIKDLSEIIKTGIIPKKQISSTDKLFDAIRGKNYELALSLRSEYIRNKNIEANDNAIYILLTEIQNLVNKKKNTSYGVKEQSQEIEPVKTTSNLFADIIGYLMKNDLDNSFKTLRNYLVSIGKKQYEFLIIDLIKISLIEGDIAFTKPMGILTYIARENFEFNISEYIQNFYETLVQNEFDKSRIYLDIISKSNILGQPCVLTKELETVLNNTEKILNYQRNNEILNRVEQLVQNVSASKSDTKTYFIIPTSSFQNDVDDYYGIEQIEQIAALVSSGMTIDDACLKVGLDDEQKSIVTLIFAKECYTEGDYTLGDNYLKKFEKTKNKSKFAKLLFEEIKQNKRFYKNRVKKGQKHLMLTPFQKSGCES